MKGLEREDDLEKEYDDGHEGRGKEGLMEFIESLSEDVVECSSKITQEKVIKNTYNMSKY